MSTGTDRSNLRTLSVCHLVWAAIVFLFSFMPVMHIYMGKQIVEGRSPFFFPSPPSGAQAPSFPPEMGWMFIIFGVVFILGGIALACLTLLSALAIRNRKRRVLSIVVAGLNCLLMPVGTVLGVFTIILLTRPTVLNLYNEVSNQASDAISEPARARIPQRIKVDVGH